MCCPLLRCAMLSVSVWVWPETCMQQAWYQSAPVLQVDTLRDGNFFGEDSLLTLPPSDELLKVGVGSLPPANRGVDMHFRHHQASLNMGNCSVAAFFAGRLWTVQSESHPASSCSTRTAAALQGPTKLAGASLLPHCIVPCASPCNLSHSMPCCHALPAC